MRCFRIEEMNSIFKKCEVHATARLAGHIRRQLDGHAEFRMIIETEFDKFVGAQHLNQIDTGAEAGCGISRN